MIIEQIDAYLESTIRQSPCLSNRASELGHECERYLVFRRLRWREGTLPNVHLQRLFNDGNLHEKAVLRLLEEAGFTVIDQQRDYEWREFNITGHLDGKLLIEKSHGLLQQAAVPLEIKSMSPFIWMKINSAEDMLTAAAHVRRYPAQLQLYMLLSNSEEAVLLLKNKATGQLKEIWLTLDYEYAESLLQKAKRVNSYVEREEIPPPIEWTDAVCGRCPFNHICAVEVKRTPMAIRFDPDFELILKRRDELKAAAREYKQVDELVKAALDGQEKVIIGDYLIEGKQVERRAYTVKASRYWRYDISNLQLIQEVPHETE